MSRRNLRIYNGPTDELGALEEPDRRQTIDVTLGEIFPLLADAVRSERTWLTDFDDDTITISADLYEVILAYQHYRRPSA